MRLTDAVLPSLWVDNMSYKYILLDLDGTVTDSAEGVINSVAYSLEKLGYPVEDKSTLMKFIGPPLTESFKDFYNFDEETIQLGVKYYREYYTDTGIFENRLYDGIEHLLKTLKKHGRTVILATSKPEVYAKRILDRFGVSEYFDLIAGSTFDSERNTKTDVLKYALKEAGIEDLSTAVMVGDRKHDIIGSHDVGLECISILYGYGNEDEFKEYGADFIVETVGKLERFLLYYENKRTPLELKIYPESEKLCDITFEPVNIYLQGEGEHQPNEKYEPYFEEWHNYPEPLVIGCEEYERLLEKYLVMFYPSEDAYDHIPEAWLDEVGGGFLTASSYEQLIKGIGSDFDFYSEEECEFYGTFLNWLQKALETTDVVIMSSDSED